MPSKDGTVACLVDGGLQVPIVGHALGVLLEVIVGEHLVAELILGNRLLRDLLHMEVIHHEVACAILVAALVGTVRTDAEQQVVAFLQGDIDHHALHVLCGG